VPALAEARLHFPAASKTAVMKELVRETTRYTVENPGSNVTLVPGSEKDSPKPGYYEALVSFIGKAAHSSLPAKGHNAALDALSFFSDIETLPAPVRAFIQFLAFVGAESDGSNLQIASTHPFVGDTTSVLSLVSVGATGGDANLNIRPTMGLPCETVMAKVNEAARAYSDLTGLEITVDENERMLEAIYLDPDKPGVGGFLRSLQAAYEAVTGEPGEIRAIGGTTYAKALPNCCAFGPVKNGVDEELAHQADEHLAVSSIRRNALIYGLSIALMGHQ
jgi:succinyl-diaminopimelate desuccinylase